MALVGGVSDGSSAHRVDELGVGRVGRGAKPRRAGGGAPEISLTRNRVGTYKPFRCNLAENANHVPTMPPDQVSSTAFTTDMPPKNQITEMLTPMATDHKAMTRGSVSVPRETKLTLATPLAPKTRNRNGKISIPTSNGSSSTANSRRFYTEATHSLCWQEWTRSYDAHPSPSADGGAPTWGR